MLIIQPIGGLCNRMRAINSARILAQKRGEKLTVIWFVNPELGCPFEELYESTKDFKIINIHTKWDPRKVLFQLLCKPLSNDQIRKERVDGNLPDSFAKALPKNLYISTEEHFFVNHDYSCFIPRAEIMAKIERLTRQFGDHKVGVHIRRTDNKPAIGKSSTDAFVSCMQEELNAYPDTTFYIATDDLSEEENLRAQFGDHIISNVGRDLSRDSISGIKDALVDLMCLSKNDKIIGSFFSSFTDIAADMNQIPKQIAGE